MEDHLITESERIDAKKSPIGAAEALEMARTAHQIHAAKGKKVIVIEKGAPDDEIRKAIIGPSGNLRAPTLWVGKKWFVGFNEDMYAQLLGDL